MFLAELAGRPRPIPAACRLVRAACATVATLLLIAGCATDPPPGASDADLQAFTAGGYRSGERKVAATTNHVWQLGGQPRNVVLSVPEAVNAAPVVIYLPGLGEASEAGELWRAAWAAAGYAVVSVQLLAADEGAWTSPLARRGEFRRLGLERFGAPAARQRLQLLADAIAEGKRRASQGETAWSRIDWNRVAIAGYDVGAYTAMIAAGETIDGEQDRTPLPIRAVIALSPFVNPAPGAVDRRYRDIKVPVLFVTSNVDDDPLGLTEGAGQRGVPFDRLAGTGAYLLTVRELSHARLAGGAGALKPDPTKSRDRDEVGGELGPRRGTTQRPPQDERDAPIFERPRAVERAVVRGLSGNELRMRVEAAQAISTAFLDATVKDDARGREWLATAAPKWVSSVGTLRGK